MSEKVTQLIEEVKALIDYHQCYENRETMQDKKLIYAGEPYFYLRVLNENDKPSGI